MFPHPSPFQLLSLDSCYCLLVPLKMQLSPTLQTWSVQHLGASWPWIGKGWGFCLCLGGTHTSRRWVLLTPLVNDCQPPALSIYLPAYSSHFSKHSPKQLLHGLGAWTLVSIELSRHSLGRCEEWILSHSGPHLPGTQKETQKAGSCPAWCIWVIQQWLFSPASPKLCQRRGNNG